MTAKYNNKHPGLNEERQVLINYKWMSLLFWTGKKKYPEKVDHADPDNGKGTPILIYLSIFSFRNIFFTIIALLSHSIEIFRS